MGDLPDFQERPLELMLELANDHPPLTKINFGPVPQYVISDPTAAKQVLRTNNRSFIKEQMMMDITRTVLKTGRNLFTSDSDPWLKRRRTMQPTFHRKMVANFSEAIVSATTRAMTSWDDGKPLDIEEAMMEVTMDVIGRTMLSQDILTDHPQLYAAFETASEHIIYRATSMIGRFTPQFLPTARNRAFKQALATVRGMLSEAIAKRIAMPEAKRPADLLTMMLAGRDDESGFTFAPEQLMDELYGIVTAGHETSSITLAALFYELAAQPKIMDKVVAELDTQLNGRLPTATDLPQLPALNNAINETMRRYPAAYITTRQTVEPVKLLGHTIPAKTAVIINIYGLHHHKDLWHEPMRFDPDRWQQDDINNDAFLPFGAGPRRCIGEPLARLEMALIATAILQRFRFEVARPMIMRAGFTLRAVDGIWLQPLER